MRIYDVRNICLGTNNVLKSEFNQHVCTIRTIMMSRSEDDSGYIPIIRFDSCN